MNQFDLWRPSVAKHLEGKNIVFGGELAKACGRTYSTMDRDGWATFAAVIKSLGWRKAKVDGIPVWEAPSAQPQLSL